MNPAFLDTGYVLALELANDQSHFRVKDHWRGLANRLPTLVTTTYVFDEIVTFFNSRGYHEKAVEVGNRLLQSATVRMIHVDEDIFVLGWNYFVRHQDKRFSLTDCVSFVIMERLGISTALSVDRHFAQAGFLVEPGDA
ncbi:MAG: PIN domain-containing protein [Pirellulaceae bacterium]|nr:PIN domain-containing protein [Pirellulaceae bacterium]